MVRYLIFFHHTDCYCSKEHLIKCDNVVHSMVVSNAKQPTSQPTKYVLYEYIYIFVCIIRVCACACGITLALLMRYFMSLFLSLGYIHAHHLTKWGYVHVPYLRKSYYRLLYCWHCSSAALWTEYFYPISKCSCISTEIVLNVFEIRSLIAKISQQQKKNLRRKMENIFADLAYHNVYAYYYFYSFV